MAESSILAPATWLARACVCCGSSDLARTPAILMPFVADRALGWAPVEIDAAWNLRTLPSGLALSRCTTLECRGCGLLFLDIRFSDAQMADLYSDYRGERYAALREHYEPGYRLRNAQLNLPATHIGQVEAFLLAHGDLPKRVLDWGGDTGKNTPFLGQASTIDVFDISGMAPVDGVTAVSAATALSRHYDLVVCAQVLEHLPYPLELLKTLRPLVEDGARLYCEVPYEPVMAKAPGAHGRGIEKRHWHEHINFYTPQSLEALVRAAGFAPVVSTVLNVESEGRTVGVLAILCESLAGWQDPSTAPPA